MKILMLGDVFSNVGRRMIEKYLPQIKSDYQIDFTIVNGENISHGKGISATHYQFLKTHGVDVITSGNHVFKNKEVFEYIEKVPDLLRPANMFSYTPGVGSSVFSVKNKTIRVTNLIGKSFMEPCNNPYEVMDQIIVNNTADIHVVDFHAEASAEKMAFAYNYDGVITALVGTHTHVQTADERLLPKKTAYLTDLGMTGCYESIIGAEVDKIIYKEKTGLPVKFEPAKGKGQICGAILLIDDKTNKCFAIERVFIYE